MDPRFHQTKTIGIRFERRTLKHRGYHISLKMWLIKYQSVQCDESWQAMIKVETNFLPEKQNILKIFL